LAYGPARFVSDAAAAGADGLIVPDLPPEEAGAIAAACAAHGLALVCLAAPTTTDERLAQLAAAATGFLYLVSVAGVTGARAGLPPGLADFIGRARRVARTPIAVGFGIAAPAQARAVGRLADGVIVGSALINAVMDAGDPTAAARFVAGLRAALDTGREPALEGTK
jgi:tryptophan synthase alpha chain